jgi:protein-disulfide isomerase
MQAMQAAVLLSCCHCTAALCHAADRKQKRQKSQGKGAAAAAAAQQREVAVALFADSEGKQPLPGSVLNADAWRPGSMLQVGAARFAIAFNPPTIDKVRAGKACLHTGMGFLLLVCMYDMGAG